MRTPCRDNHVVTGFGVQVRFSGNMEADCSLGDEEGFVVHFVPVGRRSLCVWRDDEFHAAEAHVWHTRSVWILPIHLGTCRLEARKIRMVLGIPVFDPSSITRNFIFPKERISPALAGTKLTGTLGTSIAVVLCCVLYLGRCFIS